VIQQKSEPSSKRKFSGYADEKTKTALRILYSGGHTMDDQGKKYHDPKCAYCESTVEVVATLEVEHYRPKKAVKEVANHKGYYWLAYEWTNLLYACPKCNGTSNKGSRFPIAGMRVKEESMHNGEISYAAFDIQSPILADEKPLLLNPEIDRDLATHFAFTRNGEIEGNTIRGKATIDICDLNRDGLIKARKQLVDDALSNLKAIILAFVARNSQIEADVVKHLKAVFDKIVKYDPDRFSYTLFRKWASNDFESFYISQISPDYQPALRNAYQLYLNNEL
jgi:hypothetical protein